MAGQRLLRHVDYSEALEELNVARDCASITLQRPRKIADRGWSFLQLFEQQHPLFGQDMKQRLNVLKGDYSGRRDPGTAIRHSRQFASPFKERVRRFHADFSLSHV